MKPTKNSFLAVESACKAIGIPNLVDVIATSLLSQLQPIFGHTFTRWARTRKAPDLLHQYEQSGELLGTSSIPNSMCIILHWRAMMLQKISSRVLKHLRLHPWEQMLF